MSRRRLQQKGDLRQSGGWWWVRWKVDIIDAQGRPGRQWSPSVQVGPAPGNDLGLPPLTEKQARRKAWDEYLSKLDQHVNTPQSIVTVREFVERRFQPEHVDLLKPAGQAHYTFMLPHVLKAIGDLQLRDTRYEHIQQLVSATLKQTYQRPGQKTPRRYSTQTATHIRNVASAIFSHAIKVGWHPGPNPAAQVKLPEMVRREAHALTFEQVQRLLAALPQPEHDMVLALVLTSMNIAELCGLQWRHVNLTEGWTMLGDEAIPPQHIAIRQQWYRGAYGSLKKKARKRDVPLTALLVDVLIARRPGAAVDAPVFAGRTGRPIDEHNAMRRHIKPVTRALGMPWVSWHVFRRTHTTLAAQLGASPLDRQALMGHADLRMTALYTLPDQQRRRKVLEEMAGKLMGERQGGVQ